MSTLAVTLRSDGVQVTPGATAAFTVDVSNLGTVVDRYTCEIVGMPAGWYTVSPASLELFPQVDPGDARARATAPPSSGRFTVNVHPPRASDATAGFRPIGAKVVSEADPTNRQVEEGTLVFMPFGALDGRLRPAVGAGRFRASGTLEIVNGGNRPETVTLAGSDPADRVRFEVATDTVTVDPGATKNIPFRVTAGSPRLFGGRETLPYTIGLRTGSSDTPPVNLAGVFDHNAIVPSGIPAAVATLVALGMGALALVAIMRPLTPPLAGDATSPSPTHSAQSGVAVASASVPSASATTPTRPPASSNPSASAATPSLRVGPLFLVDPTVTSTVMAADPLGTGDCTGLPKDVQIDFAVTSPAQVAVVQLWTKRPGETKYGRSSQVFTQTGAQYSGHIQTVADNITTAGTLSFYIVAIDSEKRSAKTTPMSLRVSRCDTEAVISGREYDEADASGKYYPGCGTTPMSWFFSIRDADGDKGHIKSATLNFTFNGPGGPKSGSIALKQNRLFFTHWAGDIPPAVIAASLGATTLSWQMTSVDPTGGQTTVSSTDALGWACG